MLRGNALFTDPVLSLFSFSPLFSFFTLLTMFRTAATRSIQSITRSIPKRTFTQSVIARNAAGLPTSLQAFTEEELMLKDTGTQNIYILCSTL